MTSNDHQDDRTRTYVPLTRGTMVSHYRIVEKIGAGGMGEVYLAEHTELNRKVALKFLPLHLCQDADCRARFKREAQAAAKLDHPNIVTVYEVGEYQGRPFFSMQHVEGQSLKEVIAGKTLPLERIIEIGIQVCDGLQAAHEKGITHRDIKPSNILIDSHGRGRIVDFGLASVMGTDHLTKTGSTLGTVGYMSPEQVRGETADHRTDLFSFGVVLYEMITGHAPFKAGSEVATLHAITNAKPELLARFRRDVPDALQTIIDKTLDKDVATRYQHADDLVADLKRLSSAASSRQTPRRDWWNRYVVTAAVAVLLIMVGYWGVTTFLTRENREPESARKMLAVLPFENLSPDPDQEYFSDGLTEELTSSLSQIQSLCVISRSSSMTFKGSNKTIPEIAMALKVQYIVEGSVRKAGNELRITAQLIDAADNAYLWAKTYAGTLEAVFDIQDSVTCVIVEGIKLQLTPDEASRLGKRSFTSTAAFEFYLKGRAAIEIGTEAAVNRGLEFLKQGIDIFGDNALIYCGMALGYWVMVNNGFAQEQGVLKAQEYAQRALELDPQLPEAHAMLGWIECAFLGDQRRAVERFKRALAVDPDNNAALQGLAVVYYEYVGKSSAAVQLIRRYLVVCPVDSVAKFIHQGGLQWSLGEYDQALEQYRQIHQVGQRDPLNEFWYALALAFCDDTSGATSIVEESMKSDSTSAIARLGQVMVFALREDRAGAFRALTPEVQSTCMRDASWSYQLGAILARVGAKEEALTWLSNAVDKGFINYPSWRKDPFLDSIRDDERFKKLMERVKHEWENFDV